MTAPAGAISVFLRVGDTDEAHVGDIDVDLVPTEDPTVVRVQVGVAGALPELLRAVADEIEFAAGED